MLIRLYNYYELILVLCICSLVAQIHQWLLIISNGILCDMFLSELVGSSTWKHLSASHLWDHLYLSHHLG